MSRSKSMAVSTAALMPGIVASFTTNASHGPLILGMQESESRKLFTASPAIPTNEKLSRRFQCRAKLLIAPFFCF
jgi:hypothetical protein